MCNLTGIEFLEEYKRNRNRFYPISKRVWIQNIGSFNCGEILEGVPYFCDCWGCDGATFLDYYIPEEPIKGMAAEGITKLFEERGIFKLHGSSPYKPEIKQIESLKGETPQVNYSLVVGDEDGIYLDSGNVYPYSILNNYLVKNPYEDTNLIPEALHGQA